jgi:hypothetical protein
MLEDILLLGLAVSFLVIVLEKFKFFSYIQARYGISPCFFCWGFWIAVILSVARFFMIHDDFLNFFLYCREIVLLPACASVVNGFLTRVIITTEYGNN